MECHIYKYNNKDSFFSRCFASIFSFILQVLRESHVRKKNNFEEIANTI